MFQTWIIVTFVHKNNNYLKWEENYIKNVVPIQQKYVIY